MDNILAGSYDLHIHTSPDVRPRKSTDLELAKRLRAVGMRGCAIKCHYGDTTAQAAIIREVYPDFEMVGGLTLNRSCGGLNPYAVEAMAKRGGKMLWFPTEDNRHFYIFMNEGRELPCLISLLDDGGKLVPEASDVLTVAAQYGLVVCTGHSSEHEAVALIEEGHRLGVRKMILTHAEHASTFISPQMQRYCVDLGATVEHCFHNCFRGWVSFEEQLAQIRNVGYENVILTTDLGQADTIYPDRGMFEFIKTLLKLGVKENEVETMIKKVPYHLLHS